MGLAEAFERVEAMILPSISIMLEALLEAAALGQSGIDPQAYAAELRTIALQLEALIREVEAISPARVDPHVYRACSAA